MKKSKEQKAQSILEYVIVFTAIVAIIIAAATTFIKPAVEKSLRDAKSAIEGAAGKIPDAVPPVAPPPK